MPQCVKECQQDHCASHPRHWSLLLSVKVCRYHIRTWQVGKRRRPSGVGGNNEDHDLDENEIYKFLGIEQTDGIRRKTVFE